MKPLFNQPFDIRLFFVIFFLILNTSINFFSFPLKIGSLIGVGSLFYLNKSDLKYLFFVLKFLLFSIGFIFIFILRAFVFGHEPTLFINIYINFLFFLIIAISFSKYFTDGSFLKYFIYTVFINSLIIVIEFFSPEIKNLIESFLYQDLNGNISYSTHDFRFRGLAQGGGAALGLLNLLAIICITNIRDFSIKGFFFVSVIYLSTFFISRSSIIYGTLLFLIYISSLFYHSKYKLFISFLGLAIILVLYQLFNYYFQKLDFNISWFYWAFDWAETFLESGELVFSNSSIEQLSEETKFKFNTISFFIGNGFYSGNSLWLLQSDSGYWRLFNSIGIGALIYYISFMYLLIKYLNFEFFLTILFLITLMLFEYKESVLIQNYSFRLTTLLLILNYRHKCLKT